MPVPRLWIVATILALGCTTQRPAGAAETTAERVALIDYDFQTPAPEARTDPRLFGRHLTAHGLTQGWQAMEDNGMWMLGSHAQVEFWAEGTHCEIVIEVATNAKVAGRGQRLGLRLNDHELDSLNVGDWDHAQTRTCAVPASALRQGWNRLEFSATCWNDTVVPGRRERDLPYAVFFKRFAITLLSTPEQKARLQMLYAAPETAPPWRWTFATAVDSSNSATTRPDLLIILLDAARRDHFGCYGYPRDTTPFIDELAASGLRFEHVFTDVPFTRGAVPTLLTGHSWVHHRVTGRRGVLGPSLPTLAECLAQAGYATLGVSHNPNASVAAGTDRGFEEFVEVWKLPGPRKRGMEAPSRFLIERLEEGLPESPVFCYLHVVPPHAPYVPRPQDDLWSDPDYAGVLRNAGRDLRLLDRGVLPYDEADRQHVIDLYDGNLRRGDALVQSVVTAWHRLRPGHELLTVIVADHGEAFAEHGRFEHSSTLYDEMTAIPLIIHPASLSQSLAVATAKLRSIADVAPMLLQTLGVFRSGPAYLPESYVRLETDPAWDRPYVVMRANTLFGVRTPRYLALFDRWGGQALYDLSVDPRAEIDLHYERPALYVELAGWMRATEREPGIPAPEATEAPRLDREALKALGYVDR